MMRKTKWDHVLKIELLIQSKKGKISKNFGI